MIEFAEDKNGTISGNCSDYDVDYININACGSDATLDGRFSVAQIEQILTKMKELQGEKV